MHGVGRGPLNTTTVSASHELYLVGLLRVNCFELYARIQKGSY